MRIGEEAGCATSTGFSSWDVLNVAIPKLSSFLMVPISSSEILFLGGFRDGRMIGEVSVLNLADLKMKVLISDCSNYEFLPLINAYSLSKAGIVTAIVSRQKSGEKDLISYSRTCGNRIRVLAEGSIN